MESRRVLVTGCSGFLGRYVVKELERAGHEVLGLDILEPASPIAHYRKGDFTSRTDLDGTLKGINAVCHLGGVGDVYLAERDPALAFRANAFGTKALCDACDSHRVDELIYASTWEVYGKPFTNPIDEAHPCNPESAYSISKLAGELVVRQSGSASNLKTVSLRLGTAYGPAMRETAVISRFIALASSSKPLQVHGDGTQYRQFTHANDIALSFILALQTSPPEPVYNIVSDQRIAIRELAELVASRFDVPIEFHPARRSEPPSAVISSERAKRDLNWQVSTSFAEGLDELLRGAESTPARSPSHGGQLSS